MRKECCGKRCEATASVIAVSSVLEQFGREKMSDLIFIALTIVFFLVALAYVRGCEKLQ
jgi:hypothetical protein